MAIGAVIAAAPTIIQSANSLIGLAGGNKEDPKRLAANDAAYKAAIAGDGYALDFLKYRSGRNGISPAAIPGWTGEPIGGWATQFAKDDANTKYGLASGAKDAGLTVSQITGKVGDAAQTVAQATGHTIVPGTKSELTIWLIVAAVVLFVLARRFGR